MLHSRLLTALGAGIGILFLAAAASAQPATEQGNAPPQSVEISAGDLGAALDAYIRQTGVQLIYRDEEVLGLQTAGTSGAESHQAALTELLEGTGLIVTRDPSGAMAVSDPSRLAPGSSAQGSDSTVGQRQPGIEEIIVTGQKREERIQDVPIAISAFSPEDLEAQKIEGGFDLLKGVPNVSFTKTNFSGYNFQIRGIGTQAISATTDPGVAVSFNNTTLIVNRLFEQEYLDVERVEVLRGPQGTLFGRNATAGVINVISNKPELGVWDGMIDVEVGNYNTRRLRGFFNAPIGDEFAIRGAYASTQRDGFGINEAHGRPGVDVRRDVDGRDLWTGRLTLGWQPHDRLRVNLLWERFEEDDNRVRTSKQLCHRDPSPTEISGVGISVSTENVRSGNRHMWSQGCEGGSLYSDDAFGTVNGASLPFVAALIESVNFGSFFGNEWGMGPSPWHPHDDGIELEDPADVPCQNLVPPFSGVPFQHTYVHNRCPSDDPYGGQPQSRDLRTIYSEIEPTYKASADIFELSLDFEVSDNLLLSSQTVYVEDEITASQDFNRFTTPVPFWNDGRQACGRKESAFISGKSEIDCSDDPDTGRGTYLSLQDQDGNGIIDVANQPLKDGQTVDGDGFVRDADGRRVGWFSHFFPGEFCDPQLGCSDKLVVQDLSRAKSEQFNQEFRLVSDFDGPVNFSLGANYTKFETLNDYFVFSNALTALLHTPVFNGPHPADGAGRDGDPNLIGSPFPEEVEDQLGIFPCRPHEVDDVEGKFRRFCRHIDPSPLRDIVDGTVDGEGHNYFRSANPYELESAALFGELYWNITDTLKLTVGARMTWDQKVFTPIPSQLLLADYRDMGFIGEGDPPPTGEDCANAAQHGCPLTGNALDGRGSPANPDIVQNWREPTGRIVLDWQPLLDFTDETMVYASFSHGYKGGGANPPTVAPPSGNLLAVASGRAVPPTFEPEFVNAYEIGTKNTLFGGGLVLNATAFYYDYTDYQVSKIVDRSAANENFDAKIRGAELEAVFAPSLNWQFNAAIGYLDTEIAEGERSIDLMDRAAGGDTSFTTPGGWTWEGYTVIKPWIVASSNCVIPTQILMGWIEEVNQGGLSGTAGALCPAGGIQGGHFGRFGAGPVPYFDEDGKFWTTDGPFNPILGRPFGPCDPSVQDNCSTRTYNSATDSPNKAAGFAKDLGGNELPNAPHLTVALGGQYNFDLTRDWRATARVDYYWQDESYARVYNFEPYDRLKSWSNTNLSFWITNPNNGITVEGYVKNVFDETPITGTFLNADDNGLTTNVFTLDPRLIGVSVRKEF